MTDKEEKKSNKWIIVLSIIFVVLVSIISYWWWFRPEPIAKVETSFVNVTTCHGKSEKITDFTLQCIKGGNPLSDEEGEDLVKQCENTAVEFFCQYTVLEIIRYYDKDDDDVIVKCTTTDNQLIACDRNGYLFTIKD